MFAHEQRVNYGMTYVPMNDRLSTIIQVLKNLVRVLKSKTKVVRMTTKVKGHPTSFCPQSFVVLIFPGKLFTRKLRL